MVCNNCGVGNSRDSRFCKNCGREIPAHTPPPEAMQRIEQRLEDAFQNFHEGRNEEAASATSEILALEPDNVSALALKAMIHERRGETQAAIETYERVVALNPDSVTDRLKLENLKHPGRSVPLVERQPRRSALLPAAISALAVMVVGLLCLTIIAIANLDRRRQEPRNVVASPLGMGVQTPGETPAQADRNVRERERGDVAESAGQPTSQPVAAGPAAVGPAQPVIVDSRMIANSPTTVRPRPAAVKPTSVKKPPGSSTLVMPDPAISATASNAAPPPAKASAERKSPPVYDIRVTGGGRATGANASGGASGDTEAQSLMRIGRDYYLAGNYRQAIAAYAKALPLTGQKAKIYQQIGTCYRYLNDTPNAIANFDRAVAAYQQMIARGTDVETANQGVRTCQTTLAMLREESQP